jgi:hypothetical protein
LTKADKHGKLYDSTLKWSTSASSIAYIAEKKLGTTLKCLALSGSKDKTDNAPNDLVSCQTGLTLYFFQNFLFFFFVVNQQELFDKLYGHMGRTNEQQKPIRNYNI